MKFFIIALGLIAVVAIDQMVVAQAPRSVWDGVYSKEQAKRGQSLYGQKCSSCHGPSMEGADEAPPLAGAAFAANWDGHTLGELFDKIQLSMPGNDPGTLSPRQNADILSYMLSLGKFPAGKTELPRETETLNQILFAASKPSQDQLVKAIAAATRNPAELFGLHELGTVATWKGADFIVLNANPLDDIANTRRIASVYLRDQEVDRARLRAKWTGRSSSNEHSP